MQNDEDEIALIDHLRMWFLIGAHYNKRIVSMCRVLGKFAYHQPGEQNKENKQLVKILILRSEFWWPHVIQVSYLMVMVGALS